MESLMPSVCSLFIIFLCCIFCFLCKDSCGNCFGIGKLFEGIKSPF